MENGKLAQAIVIEAHEVLAAIHKELAKPNTDPFGVAHLAGALNTLVRCLTTLGSGQ